ncbi:MAG: SGNH/GDSL hydrolase family protein, partial [Trichodesmium sp. St5_bin8]|nr:SGNH/GDSL hydrolase family protein [Trichodesmium sp. St5_bin8]
MKKLNNLLINIGLIFVALITGILAGEIGLRVAKIEGLKKANNNEPHRPTIFHTHDPHRGWALQPGFTAWWREEGEAYIEINSDGLRDHEYSKIKPENTLRIAILGDSFAEAVQVPIEKTFWSIIEQKLTKCDSI